MSKKIITIGRQFGSGGHEIGERLSKLLGIPLYDRNLVEMAAEKVGMDTEVAVSIDEKALLNFMTTYQAPCCSNSAYYLGEYGETESDKLFLAQAAIIKGLAEQGPCIIIGRGADFVLKDYPGLINVFICASKEDRIKRLMEVRNYSKKEAESKMKKNDRSRRTYYETYTGQEWGSIHSHQMLLNVSLLGADHIVEILKNIYESDIKL